MLAACGINKRVASTYTAAGTFTLLQPLITTLASANWFQSIFESAVRKIFVSNSSNVPNTIVLANGCSAEVISIYAQVGIIASAEQVMATNVLLYRDQSCALI